MSSRLNKTLWTNVCRLKLLTKADAPVRFILETTPFDDWDEVEPTLPSDEYCITGRIFPQSEIYKESSFRIEMKLTIKYPQEPPIVRFITPIYHPNIEKDGKLREKKEYFLFMIDFEFYRNVLSSFINANFSLEKRYDSS